mmetsp:Transcript_56076/g.103781  ORF Transcript_56076/g.103781 Transcript_56076/m.103781 type:complete len:450 (-) Transcript_56076:124-1473(-)
MAATFAQGDSTPLRFEQRVRGSFNNFREQLASRRARRTVDVSAEQEPMRVDAAACRSFGSSNGEASPSVGHRPALDAPPPTSFESVKASGICSFNTDDGFDSNRAGGYPSFDVKGCSFKTDDGFLDYPATVQIPSAACSTSASGPPSVHPPDDEAPEAEELLELRKRAEAAQAKALRAAEEANELQLQYEAAQAKVHPRRVDMPPLGLQQQYFQQAYPGLMQFSNFAYANAAPCPYAPCPEMYGQLDSDTVPPPQLEVDWAGLAGKLQESVGGAIKKLQNKKSAGSKAAVPARQVPDEEKTTLMLRNIPNNYTRADMLDLLDTLRDDDGVALATRYDFFYLPIDFGSNRGKGFAFVNLVSNSDALRAWQMLDNFSGWKGSSTKCLKVVWALDEYQGLAANIEHYRNNEVMHPAWDDSVRPLVFENGVPVAFPGPTEKIPTPRRRRGKQT